MPTSVRLDSKTESIVARLARETGRTKSQIIRDAISALADAKTWARPDQTPYERIKHLIGIASGGPPALSIRTGEKFTRLLLAGRRQRDSR